MKKQITFLLLALSLSLTHAQWQKSNGPFQSIIKSFAQRGTNLFAVGGTDGVFVSTNQGLSWEERNNGLPTQVRFYYTLYIDSAALFLGTDQGVFTSDDEGDNWAMLNNGIPANTKVYSFIVDSVNLYAGTSAGVFLSNNKGNTWTAANTGLPANITIRSFAANDSVLFAGTSMGVYASMDNGMSWTAKNNGLPTVMYTYSITSEGNDIYAGLPDGVYLSTDNGQNWIARNTGMPTSYGISLLSSGSELYAGTQVGLYVSRNKGNSWSVIKNGMSSLAYDNSSTEAILFTGADIFSGGNDGVSFSPDSGSTWQGLNSGLPYINLGSLATNGEIVYAGTDQGLYTTHDNGNTWDRKLNYWTSSVLAKDSSIFIGNSWGLIYVSHDYGENWARALGFFDNGEDVIALTGSTVFAKYNGMLGYISTDSGAFFTRQDLPYSIFANRDDTSLFAVDSMVHYYDGNSWGPTSIPIQDDTVYSLAVNASYLFIGTNGGILKTTYTGSNWQKVNFGSATAHITGLAVNGANLYATTSDHEIFSSANHGDSWISITDNFADSIIGKEPFVFEGKYMLLNKTHIFVAGKKGIWTRPLSELVGIEEDIELNPYSIYPNPSSGNFTIEGEEITGVMIRDIFGKIIYTLADLQSSEIAIDLSAFAKGVYLVTISNTEKTQTQKIVIQ